MSAWECPRCGVMNAIWVERCSCPPRTYVSDTTDYEPPPETPGGTGYEETGWPPGGFRSLLKRKKGTA